MAGYIFYGAYLLVTIRQLTNCLIKTNACHITWRHSSKLVVLHTTHTKKNGIIT